MKKLVTGIEAIQSGKLWKHKNSLEWIKPNNDSHTVTPFYLMLKEFVIKEEPREFWIFIDNVGDPLRVSIEDKTNISNWIKVREVEE